MPLRLVGWTGEIFDSFLEDAHIIFSVAKHYIADVAKNSPNLFSLVAVIGSPTNPSPWSIRFANCTSTALRNKKIVPLFKSNSIKFQENSCTLTLPIFDVVFSVVNLLKFSVFEQEFLRSCPLGRKSALLIGFYLILMSLAISTLIRFSPLDAFFEGFGTLVLWSRHARNKVRVRSWPNVRSIRRLHFTTLILSISRGLWVDYA